MTVTRTGRCMCGAIRFEARDEPFDVTHCHCHSCRSPATGSSRLPSAARIAGTTIHRQVCVAVSAVTVERH